MKGTLRIPWATLPAVHGRLRQSVDRLTASAPVIRCAHVTEGSNGVVCAEHPGAGLMCEDCATGHAARHPHDVEHRCDGCGEVVEEIHAMIGTADVVVPTLTTTGCTAVYVGPVLVVALGVCVPCGGAAGLEVAPS